jgi:hypothetical protein
MIKLFFYQVSENVEKQKTDGLCTEEWRDKDFEGGKVYLACCPQVSESQSSAAVPALEFCQGFCQFCLVFIICVVKTEDFFFFFFFFFF